MTFNNDILQTTILHSRNVTITQNYMVTRAEKGQRSDEQRVIGHSIVFLFFFLSEKTNHFLSTATILWLEANRL